MKIKAAFLKNFIHNNTSCQFKDVKGLSRTIEFISKQMPSRYGVYSFDRVDTQQGKATIIGSYPLIDEESLYLWFDGDIGVSYLPLKGTDLQTLGITPIAEKDYVNPAIIDYFKSIVPKIALPQCQLQGFHRKNFLSGFHQYASLNDPTNAQAVFESASQAKASNFSPKPTGLELFSWAETLCFDEEFSYDNEAFALAEELYSKIIETGSVDDPILFHTAKLRQLQITLIGKELQHQDIEDLKSRVNRLVPELVKSETIHPFNPPFLLVCLTHPLIDRKTQVSVATVLWENKTQYNHFLSLIIHILLDINYSGQKDLTVFLQEVNQNIEDLPLEDQNEIKKKIELVKSSGIETGKKLYEAKSYEEALRWYVFATNNQDNPIMIDNETIKCLELCASSSNYLSPEGKQNLNYLRFYLFKYYLQKDLNKARTYYSQIDVENFPDTVKPQFNASQALYYSDRLNALKQCITLSCQKISDMLQQRLNDDERLEAEHFKNKLTDILASVLPEDPASLANTLTDLENNLTALLKQRWEDIQESSLVYTHNTQSVINQVCYQLAAEIDPNHIYKLLMSSIENEEDGYGQNINELKFGQFILTDDKKNFIALKPLFDNAIHRVNQQETDKSLFSYLISLPDIGGRETLLTPSEQKSVTALLPKTTSFCALANERLRADALTALGAFSQLNRGLIKGDKSNGGDEYNAGKNANEAIVDFMMWFNDLEEAQQQELKKLSAVEPYSDRYTFANLLNRLVRPEVDAIWNGAHRPAVIYCVQITGRSLGNLIWTNNEFLRNFRHGHGNIRQQGAWRETSQAILSEINAPSGQINPDRKLLSPYRATTQRALIAKIKKNKDYSKNETTLDKRLAHASLGTVGYLIEDNKIKLKYVANLQGLKKECIIYFDHTLPFSFILNGRKQSFETFDQALSEIKLNDVLLTTYPNLTNTFNQLNTAIDMPANSPELRSSLLNLRTELVKESFKQLGSGQTPENVQQGPVGHVSTEISTMVRAIHHDPSKQAKVDAIKHCQENVKPTQVPKNIGKVLLAVFIAGTITALGAAVGTGIGILFGIWAGPWAAATGLAGCWKGSATGFALGTAAAASITGVSLGGLSLYSLFKRNDLQKSVDQCLNTAEDDTLRPHP
jgi:hypothetical protein